MKRQPLLLSSIFVDILYYNNNTAKNRQGSHLDSGPALTVVLALEPPPCGAKVIEGIANDFGPDMFPCPVLPLERMLPAILSWTGTVCARRRACKSIRFSGAVT